MRAHKINGNAKTRRHESKIEIQIDIGPMIMKKNIIRAGVLIERFY